VISTKKLKNEYLNKCIIKGNIESVYAYSKSLYF